MKAIQIDEYGGPEVLHFRDVLDPVAGPGEVVIDIAAASINPADWKVREGQYSNADWITLPHIPGRDFSGVVRVVAPDVTDFHPGDEVFGVTDQGQEGACAQAIAMKASIIAKKPDAISHAEAAAMALGGLTALVSIETARLDEGETILIHGGAGGVGSMAVQIAHNVGAHVIVTASAQNHDYVGGLGADDVIDYNSVDFAKACPPCDVVFDTVGGDVQARSCAVLKPGGRLVHIARGPKGFKAPGNVEVLRPDVKRSRALLDKVALLVNMGALKPPEIKAFPLAEAAQAQELSKTGHVRGKVVLMIR
ncbi:MAG: NADP-dependent oxidoreductase [Rhodospirillales bacterium]|jgi:NADPH:quinone reductase-like Zn-dependent oxidoreductase|nr:NADP-dependent oxidoreductase [Rhodospirillales bacterium]MBT5077017.1 NADP-dependent oxidoreductase [Rhodospirillales bacterium]MBT5113611.1 NADP-dependent oxidoreductase [Rhodospirillales bacterium]MBT5673909.1 NADP-dependent oxidoreductase [Rhodospirillales bacterium]MBT6186567.1 NADP-dependent oxidoreductase [Rhodospirillales bacterium]